MADNLIQILPESRRPALSEELALLDRVIEALYSLPGDLVLARIPDIQGLGGSSAGPSCR